MRVRLVRHATLLLESSLGRVLVDPMLRDAGTTPPIESTPNPKRNPLVELPLPREQVLEGVDLVLVTHLHGDHFDDLVPLDLPILTQPESADELRRRGHAANLQTDGAVLTRDRQLAAAERRQISSAAHGHARQPRSLRRGAVEMEQRLVVFPNRIAPRIRHIVDHRQPAQRALPFSSNASSPRMKASAPATVPACRSNHLRRPSTKPRKARGRCASTSRKAGFGSLYFRAT